MKGSIEAIDQRIQVQFHVPFAAKSSSRQRTKLQVIDDQNLLLSEQDARFRLLSSTARAQWKVALILSFYEVLLSASILTFAGRSHSLPFRSTLDLLDSKPNQCFVDSAAMSQKFVGLRDNGTEWRIRKGVAQITNQGTD